MRSILDGRCEIRTGHLASTVGLASPVSRPPLTLTDPWPERASRPRTIAVAVHHVAPTARPGFRLRRGRWPMEGRPAAFARDGLVVREPDGEHLEPSHAAM